MSDPIEINCDSRILTYTGKAFDLLKPRADLISTVDIAHALAHIARFNGHAKHHYSVAQHSLLVASIVPPEHQLAALLHDAAEAYVGDVTRPLKEALRRFAETLPRSVEAACETSAVSSTQVLQKLTGMTVELEGAGPFLALLSFFHQVEQRIWLAICEHFDLEPESPACIHQADMQALATERRELMPDHPDAWACLDGITPLACRINTWTPTEARQHFHSRLLELLSTTHRARARA